MKENNKKGSEVKPRVLGKAKFSGKVGILSLLMLLQTIIAFAGEAKVLRQTDTPLNDEGSINTRILLDSNNDNRVDMSMWLQGTNKSLLFMLLKEYLQPDSVITYNDNAVNQGGGLSFIRWDDILTIDGEDILDIFPDAERLFVAAAEKRRAAAQQSQQGPRR